MNIIRMLILFLLFILLNVYLFIRGWQALPDLVLVHTFYTTIYLFVASSVFIAIIAGNRLPLWIGHVLEVVGGYWMILFIFILAAALIGDLLRISNHFFNIYPEWVRANYEQSKLLYLAAVLLLLFLISVTGYFRFANPRITNLNIEVTQKNVKPDKVNIVAVSDIHLGNLIRKGRLSNWVEIINKQYPDIILIVGDIFDHNMLVVETQNMSTELKKLRSKYGVYAIPGNHDYYAGIETAIAYMEKSGIKVLRDEAVTIDSRFILIGRDDITNKDIKSLKSLMSGLNPNLPCIVLDHQPGRFNESADNGIDLHLSGHTHNGQIFPFNLIVSKMYELGYGYKKTGNTHYYVSSGLGLWGAPIRFGTHSEILRILLTVH